MIKTIAENYASVVFYKKKMDIYRQKEIRNLKSQIKVMSNKDLKIDQSHLVFIPNYWFEKAISLSYPGMMHTWHLLCKHQRVKPSYYDCFQMKKKNMNTSFLDASFIDKSYILNQEDVEESKENYTGLVVKNQSISLPKEIAQYFLEKVLLVCAI